MKSDVQIQTDIMDQMKSDSHLTASEIGVAVKDGIVTLSGQLDSYEKKTLAENIVKKIIGVKALAEDIQIGTSPCFARTDKDIADAVIKALRNHACVQEEKIKIKIENGVVRLEGEVDCDAERTKVKAAIRNLAGVTGVINLIELIPVDEDIRDKIKSALEENVNLISGSIAVEISDTEVILNGRARSVGEREEAARVAASVPGVSKVDNRIEIAIPRYAIEM